MKKHLVIIVALIILAVTIVTYVITKKGNRVYADSDTDTVDYLECQRGDQCHMSYGLGSNNIELLGARGQTCKATVTQEMEGGYSTLECDVPRTAGITKCTIPDQKHCTVIKQGNIFFDSQTK